MAENRIGIVLVTGDVGRQIILVEAAGRLVMPVGSSSGMSYGGFSEADFGPVIEHDADDMPSSRERVVVVDGAAGITASLHLVRMMDSLPFGPVILHDSDDMGGREFREELYGDDLNLLHDSLMPPPVDALDALMRERRDYGTVVIRNRNVDFDHSIRLPPEPKKSKYEELREAPKGRKRGNLKDKLSWRKRAR